MAKLKSFEQFVAEMDRAEEIQDDGVEQGTPEVKGAERAEDEAEEVQAEESPESEVALEETEEVEEEAEEVAEEEVEEGNAFGAARAEAIAKGEKEFTVDGETYPVEDVDAEDKENAEEFANESEEVEEEAEEVAEEEAEEVMESCSEMLEKCYESCKNEAKAYEEDAHDEHTIESYMKENAALVAGLAAKCLKEMKEDYAVEAYEAACNEMIEAYTKKMNEMKEAEAAYGSEEESAE